MTVAREPAVTDPGTGAPAAAIAVDGVSLTFRGARTTHVLDKVDLAVGPGEVVALIGPNGCGKSTLLRVLAGLIRADAGGVRIDGDLVRGRDRARPEALRATSLPAHPTHPPRPPRGLPRGHRAG